MTTQLRPLGRSAGSVHAGTVTLVLGILFSAAVAFTYVLSLSDAVNPPNWIRAIGLVWLPIGLGGVPIGYAIAQKGEDRDRARHGVLVGLVGLVALVSLVIAIG